MDFPTMVNFLGTGLVMTVQIFFIALIGSVPLGVLVALGRMSKFKPLSLLVRLYISIMRGTPLMLQLMAINFAPFFVFGITTDAQWKFTATYIAFILNYAAYFGEIYRSGIQSIPRGQYEAAEVLGYTRAQTFLKIVLPQVVKRIMPSMSNEIITLVKDTSLAFVLTVPELMSQTKALAAREASMVPYVMAGVVYWVLNFVVDVAMTKVEKKLDYYHD